MTVVEEYLDSKEAWIGYKNYFKQYQERGWYIFYTGKEKIEVIEQYSTEVYKRQ